MNQKIPLDVTDPTRMKPGTQPAGPERDAIVFLAGLGMAEVDDSVDETARRIASALDDEAPPVAQFHIEEGKDEDFGKSRGVEAKTRRVTIARKDGPNGPSHPLVDLYSLDYRETLIGDLLEKRPLKLLLLIFWTLLTNARKLLFSIRSNSKTSTEKWQVRMAWIMYFILVLYAVIVLGAVLGIVLPAVQSQPALPGQSSDPLVQQPNIDEPGGDPATINAEEPKPKGDMVTDGSPETSEASAEDLLARLKSTLSANLQPVTRACQVIVVWMTALGLFFKTDIKATIQKSGVETVSANRYLTLDTGKELITNRFSALLNHIAEKDDVNYRNIYIVAYSFGTIAMLDALYPHGKPPRIFQNVKYLITIGCPFDFIRTYWPDYFENRTSDSGQREWLNIFAQADVLSSDFQDIAIKGAAPKKAGIELTGGRPTLRPSKSLLYGRDKPLDDYTLIERYGLIGFRAHTQYWEEGTAGCYRDIVKELFSIHPGLG